MPFSLNKGFADWRVDKNSVNTSVIIQGDGVTEDTQLVLKLSHYSVFSNYS